MAGSLIPAVSTLPFLCQQTVLEKKSRLRRTMLGTRQFVKASATTTMQQVLGPLNGVNLFIDKAHIVLEIRGDGEGKQRERRRR